MLHLFQMINATAKNVININKIYIPMIFGIEFAVY